MNIYSNLKYTKNLYKSQLSEILLMFSNIIKNFFQERNELFKKHKGITYQEAEIGHRLIQLNWLINRAKQLNEILLKDLEDANPLYMTELEIITESFYHFAWRVEEIIKHHPTLKMGNTKIRRVRNNLIQHPEKEGSKQKIAPSFEVGGSNGPKLKSYNGPKDSYVDEGLFVNALDFINKFPEVKGKFNFTPKI